MIMSREEQARFVLQGITKRLKRRPVLQDVSLTLPAGAVTVLLGPNGSGKSTLLRVIAGMLQPDAGVRRLGDGTTLPPHAPPPRAVVLVEEPAFYPTLDGWANVRYLLRLAALADGRQTVDDQTIKDALITVGLDAVADRPVGGYSRGMRQRLGLAVVLAYQPDLVVLDEPATGLDEPGRTLLHELLDRWRAAGVAVLVTTHEVAEAETFADRVAVLVRGRIVAEGTLTELTPPVGYVVRVLPEQVTTALEALVGWPVMAQSDGLVRVTGDGTVGPAVHQALATRGVFPLASFIERQSLVAFYREVLQREGVV